MVPSGKRGRGHRQVFVTIFIYTNILYFVLHPLGKVDLKTSDPQPPKMKLFAPIPTRNVKNSTHLCTVGISFIYVLILGPFHPNKVDDAHP